ncbi:MAG: hypothetical protein KDN05_12870 [Verrucomicrobiae bacterium]|nr:hypothetical protein [Verrucomicrobiae bacterium]MCB1132018.1 hypothetical protein [Verrucomicrobiae bacterium]MCP5533878.1 hypothetical protein [Akkermansiaceae bacterium]MCP5547862.1 hypothetical protein [Akkermansiaceae bacterium]
MYGAAIFARAISQTSKPDTHGNVWQYHPRSDFHSKVICWGIVFDLMATCSLFRKHAESGRIVFGINHEMRDFRVNRKKNLDLVVATPQGEGGDFPTFAEYGQKLGLELSDEEKDTLEKLPVLGSKAVGSVLVALEAKACMTEHSKARPRLYDELSSSYQTILGDTKNAIAAGFVSVNVADTFISPLRNPMKLGDGGPIVTTHDQPKAAKGVLQKLGELPRRSGEDALGFDALGVALIRCRNDGSVVELVDQLSDGTKVDTIVNYSSLIQRIGAIYTSRFREL